MRRIAAVIASFAALALLLLLLPGLFAAVERGALALEGTARGLTNLALLLLQVSYLILLLFAIPQFLLLHRFGVSTRLPHLILGAGSGWLIHFVLATAEPATRAPRSVSGWTLLVRYMDAVIWHFPASAQHNWSTVPGFFALGAPVYGMLAGLAWSALYPVHFGQSHRDWETPVLRRFPLYWR